MEVNLKHTLYLNPLSASVALIKKPVNSANQLTGFYMRAKLALNGLILFPEPYLAINSQYMKNFTINFAIYEI